MPRRENDCCEETKKIPLEEGVSINENSDDLMNDLQRDFFHQLPKKIHHTNCVFLKMVDRLVS